MRPTIGMTARLVGTLAIAGSVSLAQESDGHTFGRLSPQRPVVEIPEDQRDGVDAANAELPPPADWQVRDENHVVEPPRPEPEPEQAAAAAAEPEGAPPAAESDPVGDLLAEDLNAAAALVANEPTPGEASAPLESRTLGPVPAETEALPESGDESPAFGWPAMARTGLALALVVGLILVLAWVYERSTRARRGLTGAAGGRSPAGLIELLARYPLGPRQSLVLLKFDRRVLLLNQTAPRGGPMVTTTLCELTDPEDVASVLVKVRDADGESINRAFRDAMERADQDTGARLGEHETTADPRFGAAVEPKPTPHTPAFEIDYDPEDLRRTVGGSEADRNQLWEELGTERASRDPIGSLRRRLEAMRGGSGG